MARRRIRDRPLAFKGPNREEFGCADIHDGQEQSNAPPRGQIQKSKTSAAHEIQLATHGRPIQCRQESFDFGTAEGRFVVGAFDGRVISPEARTLLLGATDRSITVAGVGLYDAAWHQT
jgi:hypothetical protein